MQQSKYIDFPINLKDGSALLKNESVVAQRVRLLLTTEPGELIDFPTFGTPIHQFLYDGVTEGLSDTLKIIITNAITTWLGSQVRIDSLNVRANMDTGTIAVELDLYLKEYDKNVSVVENYTV